MPFYAFAFVIGLFYTLCHTIVGTEFKECKTPIMKPDTVSLTDCNTPPCVMIKGTNITWDIVFTADNNHDEIVTSLQANLGGITQGYPGVDGKASCQNLLSITDGKSVGCPIEKGKTYRHVTRVSLNKPMPKVTVNARFALRDKKTKKDFICFELPLTLK